MSKSKNKYNKNTMATLRTAIDKYESEHGIIIKMNSGIINIVHQITGFKHSKSESWAYLKNYIGDDKLITSKTRTARKRARQYGNIINNNGYSRENACEFYQSREWRSLRVHIIEEQKGRCQMCGASYKEDGIKST